MNEYKICEKCDSWAYHLNGKCMNCPTPEEIVYYEKLKKKWTEYNHRPEVIARTKAYYQRPEVKQRLRDYWQDDKVKERKREQIKRPEVKKQKRDYYYSKKMLKVQRIVSDHTLIKDITNDINSLKIQ